MVQKEVLETQGTVPEAVDVATEIRALEKRPLKVVLEKTPFRRKRARLADRLLLSGGVYGFNFRYTKDEPFENNERAPADLLRLIGQTTVEFLEMDDLEFPMIIV